MAGTGSAQVPPRDFQQLRRADGAFVGAVAPGWLGAPYSPAAAIQGRQRARQPAVAVLGLLVPLLATAHRCKKAQFYSAHPKQHHPTAL